MDKRTLKALKGSIKKWEGIVAGTVADNGSDNCPLCHEFARHVSCRGCPVSAATGRDNCNGSPWVDWNQMMIEKHTLRFGNKASDDETVMCAVLELEFLKSLLPGKK